MTGIDLISADNATNSLSNRVAFPVTAGGVGSYEKWLKAYVDTAPANQVTNLATWGDGGVQATTTLSVGTTATGVTPTSADSTKATDAWTSYTSGAKLGWHATAMTAIGSKSVYLVFQLDVGAAASPGNWTQETLNYSLCNRAIGWQQPMRNLPKLGEYLTALWCKATPNQAYALVVWEGVTSGRGASLRDVGALLSYTEMYRDWQK